MDFNLTPERRMLCDTLERYIKDKYDIDARSQAMASAVGYRPGVWNELAELGLVGALFSEDDGGFGGDAFDIAALFEVIGRGLLLEPFLDSAVLAGGAIAAAGNKVQKQQLEGIINATVLGGFAHDEPESRYELEHVATRATRHSDQWRLTGAKAVVRHAESADFFVVSARTQGEVNDLHGISLFIVPANAPGVSIQGYHTFDGGRAADLSLANVAIDATALLGEQNNGLPVLERVVGRGILALCAEALGVMDVAKKSTVDYLQTRKQFGVPIGKFQALQHRMAEVLIEIEQARSAVINAAATIGKDRLTRERALSSAKYTIGCVGQLVAEEAIQMHGGVGMSWDLPLGHYTKRLVGIDHQLGDADHHLGRYIALGRETPAAVANTVPSRSAEVG